MIRILLADDEKILRDTVKLYLEKTGDFSLDPVESAVIALERLEHEHYDAIISDYRMPPMDGITFLKEVRARDKDIPFFLMTGQGDETIASEALNSGATFYLKKDGKVQARFASLPDRIRTAVRERQERDAAALASGSLKKQTRTLFILNEIIRAANHATDIDGLVRDVLDMTLLLLDFDAGGIYRADPAAGTATVIYAKNLPEEFLAEIGTIPVAAPPFDTLFVRNEPIITDHYEQVAPDRSKKYGFLSLASVPLVSRGRVIGALNVVSTRRHEISGQERINLISIGLELGGTIERMAAEEEVKRSAVNISTLFNSIDEMIFVLDMEGRILTVNNAVVRKLHFTEEELRNTEVIKLHVPERQDEALRVIQGMLQGFIDSCPVPVCTKEGQRIEVETKVTQGKWNGRDVLVGVTRDITERKRVERELQQKTAEMDHYFTTSLDLFCIADTDGYFRRLNPEWEHTLGYSLTELEGARFLDFVHPDDLPATLAVLGDLTKKKAVLNFTNRYRHKDGTYRWIEWRSSPSPEGNLVYAAARDITGRREAEDELRASKDRLGLILDSAAEAIYGLDMDGNCTFCNPSCLRMLRYTDPSQLIGKNMHNLIHHSHPDGTAFPVGECRIFQAFQKGEGTHVDDEVLWRADGTSFAAEYWSFPQRHDGRIVGAVVTFLDITKRTAAQEALKQSEERFRQMFELHAAVMILIDPRNGRIIDANDAAARFYGYPRAVIRTMNIAEINQLSHDKVRAEYLRAAQQARNDFIFPHRLASGEIRTVEVHSTPITIQGQTVLFSIIHDITERKQAEAAQKELETLLRLILTLSTRFINVPPQDIDREITSCLAEVGAFAGSDRSYVFLFSPDGTTMDNSYEWCADGITPQKDTLQNLPVEMFPWWMEKLRQFETIHISRVADLPEEAKAEREILESQQIRSVLVVPLIIENGLIGFLGFDNVRKERAWPDQTIALLEVTARIIANAKARKRAFAALQTSEEQLALAIEGSGAGLWDWQVKTDEIIFNERYAAITGYTLAELVPVSRQTWIDLSHPDDVKRSGELLWKHLRGETPEYEYEGRMRHKDGHWVWVLDRGKIVERDANGEPVRMTGTHLDITERKLAEKELEHRTALLTNLLTSIPDIVFFKDRSGAYLGCNPAFEEFVGKPRTAIVGHTDHDLFPAETADSFRTQDLMMMETGAPRHNEEWITYPDGRKALIDTFKAPLRTSEGRIIGLLGISRDITERKRNEEAIFEANKKLNILNSITRHDVLNQITALGLMLMILKDTVSDEKTLDFVNKAQESTDRITTQIEFTKEYQDIGVLSPMWQNVPARIAEAQKLLVTCPFEVEIATGNLEIFADPLLGKVFYNLLENAVRHGEKVTRIRFTATENGDHLLLIYEDNGAGIDPESRKHLFKRGFGKHTGFGLYMMQEILAITGIAITETGTFGNGARFEIAVPRGEYRFTES